MIVKVNKRSGPEVFFIGVEIHEMVVKLKFYAELSFKWQHILKDFLCTVAILLSYLH